MKQLVILTGGSGTGKSTVLSILKKKGYQVIEEAARRVIAEENAKPNGMSRHDPDFDLFLATKQTEAEKKINNGICFLDRSNIDGIAYCRRAGQPIKKQIETLIKNAGYEKNVFYFEMPPKKVYGTKGETFEQYDKSLIIHDLLKTAYIERGFNLINVPFDSFEKQAEFIEKKVQELTSNQEILNKT